MYQHDMYSWQGKDDNRACLIGDSLVKWVKDVKHLRVQALPGLTLSPAFVKLCDGTIDIRGFDTILFLCGTNDFENESLEEPPTAEIVEKIVTKMKAVITLLKKSVPRSKLAVSMILPRPKDKTAKLVEDLAAVNKALKVLCKNEKVIFLNTVKAVSTNGQVDPNCFARDDLHPNAQGIRGLKRFLTGATAMLLKGTKNVDHNARY
jgi:hypothetical protein